MLSPETIVPFLDILTIQRRRCCGQQTSKISEGPVTTLKCNLSSYYFLMAMNLFVLLVMFVHISGYVDHSVCLAITIVRTPG